MNDYYVYLLLDPTNFYLPFYVGKGKNNRFEKHFNDKVIDQNYYKRNKITHIRNKGYEPCVMFWQINLSESDAYDLEEELIGRFGRQIYENDGILTNICFGSRPPVRRPNPDRDEADRQRMLGNKINQGRIQSEEEKEKRRRSLKEAYRSGRRKPTQEQLDSLNQAGIKRSDKTRQKISNNARNRSEEHQRKINQSLKGKIPWNKGVTGYSIHTEESKQKMKETRNKNAKS